MAPQPRSGGTIGITAAIASIAALATLGCGLAAQPVNAVAAEGDILSAWTKPVSGNLSEPFPDKTEQALGSQKFRIPGLMRLHNGWYLASADVRWGTTADSPANIDAAVSISKDAGKTWTLSMTDHFVDVKDATTDWNGVDWPAKPNSKADRNASFIDPSILQSADGTIYRVIDAMPAYVGNFNGPQVGKQSTGLDANGNMLIGKGEADKAASVEASKYTYYIDNGTTRSVTVNGVSRTLRPIRQISDNAQQNVWVDAEYNLYDQTGDTFTPQMTKQYKTAVAKSDVDIQNNVFYSQAEWKVYPTAYLWLRKGTVTDDGISWSDPEVLHNVKTGANEGFLGTGVGLGKAVIKSDGTERLLFPVYDNVSGLHASVIYSDDAGKTWHRGQKVPGMSTSESEIVEMPNGKLRMYSRNTTNYVASSVSSDYGQTWSTAQTESALVCGADDKVSFINVAGTLTKDGKTYGNLVMGSYTVSRKRVGGIIRIGSMDADGNVTWLNANDFRYPTSEHFSYSSLAQLDGNRIGLLREITADAGRIVYDTFDITDLLNKGTVTGWTYTADTSKLTSKIADIEAANPQESAYTPDSWKTFADALADAKTIAAKTGATETEIVDALDALTAAYDALTARADTTALTAKITAVEAEQLNRDDYTADSWSTYAVALAEAKTIAADANATQAQVDAALKTLTEARDGLQAKETPDPDPEPEPGEKPATPEQKAALDKAIADAKSENLSRDDYTADSWKAYADALAEAERVAADNAATAKQVDAALKALADARAGLKAADNGKPGPTPEQPKDDGKPDGSDAGKKPVLSKTGAAADAVTAAMLLLVAAGVTVITIRRVRLH
ncbi:exo-alpha-sialidase [Bifidobacterium leontopitheci]|uniref:exo-alpha-sialidase n=1 Tax=Bifidobacterium leontopitheci TaxID=2650774 RepID=A0A6I1GQ10_9BIFI|nr:exo-alpha-sialidase [Bifidobacterium leontopitheci]KAB7791489.1 beta-galactosidase [Bifidobacterium leontopitheci]